MSRLFIAITLALAIGHAAHAQSPHQIIAQPELESVAESFLQAVKAGKAEGAFVEAFKNIPGMNLSAQTAGAATDVNIRSFGGIVDWSALAEEVYNRTFVRRTYYVRTGTVPLFFTLIFYNTGTKWGITDIQFGTYYNEKANGHLIEP